MDKSRRQEAIRKLIRKEKIGSQAAVAERLAADGFGVTQASVSRDLVELGIAKSNGVYVIGEQSKQAQTPDRVTFATAGDHLIVGRCSSGLASAITVRIDARRIDEIVGTIAGDDTIFIAVASRDEQQAVLATLASMFN